MLQQSKSATALASWLHSLTSTTSNPSEDPLDKDFKNGAFINRVWHASLQVRDSNDKDPSSNPREEDGVKNDPTGFDPKNQMKGGWPACFAFRLNGVQQAKWLPHKTTYFTPATSLGGVESLLEWRVASDPKEDPALLRISVGLEDVDDLKADIRNAILEVSKMEKEGTLK